VRRALVVCLVGFAIIVAFADAQKDAPSLTKASVGIQPTVVVDGISAREIALSPDLSVFLSMASSLNRVFELLTPALSNSSNLESNLAPVAGTGVAGSLGDGGAARIAQLSLLESNLYRRSAFAFGRDGTLYIADSENATVRSVAGSQSTEPGIIRSIAGRWAPRQNIALVKPVGLALDRAGNLYIADNGAGALDVLYANTGSLKSVAQIADASSIAVTGDGSRAFVTSPKTGSVVAVNLETGSIQELSIPVGQLTSQSATGESSSPCSTAPQQQNPSGFCPSGVAVDGAGNIFVSDLWDGRVLRVDSHSGAQAVVLSGLNEPGALSFDSGGINLFVVEQGANRIIRAEAGSPGSVLTLSPSSATFPNEAISGVSQQIQFTLTNTSASSVSGISTTFVPMVPTPSTAKNDFTAESTSCPSVLPASGTCTISVAFTPTSIGPLYYSMNVSDSVGDATDAPSLTGTGDDYQIQLASGQLQEMSVVQGNSVSYHLQIAALGVFGQNGEQVSFLCPGNMPANTTCTISPATVNPGVGSTVPFTVTFHTSSNNIYAQLPGPDSSLRGLLVLLPLIGTMAFWFRA